MIYAISTWNYLKSLGPRAQLVPALREITQRGLGVELWLDWAVEPHLLSRDQWPALRETLRGVRCLSAHSRLGHFFDLAILEQEMELCAFLGADPLVVHPRSLGLEVGTWDATAGPEVFGEPQHELLGEILRRAAGRGLRLALENGPMDLLGRVLEAADGLPGSEHLGICIDTGHANMHRDRYDEPATAFLQRFASRLIHLHLSDNGGQADDHSIPGRGSVEWYAVTQALAAAAYDGMAVLELRADPPEQATAESISFLERLGFGAMSRPL
jgi:sugar phosphate isomerase/epimerase